MKAYLLLNSISRYNQSQTFLALQSKKSLAFWQNCWKKKQNGGKQNLFWDFIYNIMRERCRRSESNSHTERINQEFSNKLAFIQFKSPF